MATKHDEVARRLAAKYGTDYNRGQGADVKADRLAIEVETEATISDAGRQLRGYRKPVYVAPTTGKGVRRALEHYEGTSVGVMDQNGKIVKRSSRGS